MVRRLYITLTILALGMTLDASPFAAQAEGSFPSFTSSEAGLPRQDSVSEYSQRGMHFEAIVAAYEGTSELSLGDKLAGARSAWALGLVDTARRLWDEALATKNFDDIERHRALLARAIVELQEGRFEDARSIAERSANTLPASDLRAQLWLVIAEALREQGAPSLAEGYYRKAIEDGSNEVQAEGRFLLAECQLKLGRINDARYSYAALDSRSKFTPRALRRLAEIDLTQRNFEGVITWIDEGRELGTADLQDGWSSYALIVAYTELGRLEDADKELLALKTRHTDQDRWYTLSEAAVTASVVRPMLSESRASMKRPEAQ